MDIFQKKVNDILVLIPEFDELDVHISYQVKVFVQKLIEQGNKKILINLRNVLHLDSSGLGTLVSVIKKSMENHDHLIISDLTEDVQRVLAVTKLDRIFTVCKSEKEGLELLNHLKN